MPFHELKLSFHSLLERLREGGSAGPKGEVMPFADKPAETTHSLVRACLRVHVCAREERAERAFESASVLTPLAPGGGRPCHARHREGMPRRNSGLVIYRGNDTLGKTC